MQIVRINNRIVHRIRGVDVDTAMAVRVLQSRSDADAAVTIAIHEQEFDLPRRAIEYLRCRDVTNRPVSFGNALGRGLGCILVNSGEDAFLLLLRLISIHDAGIDVGNSIIDIR